MTGALENQLSSVTLYERLGASAWIRSLVNAAFDVLSHNPTLTPRFLALMQSADRLDDIKCMNALHLTGARYKCWRASAMVQKLEKARVGPWKAGS